MSLRITSAKLTGNPDKEGWAQAYEFSPQDKERLDRRGRLFAIISTSAVDEGVDSLLAGRELITRLHEEYFGNLSGSAFERLKQTVRKVSDEFSSWEDVQVSAATFLEDVVYVAVSKASVWVFRGGVLSKLLQSVDAEVVSASGYPKPDDVFIIGTSHFFDAIPQGVLKGSLEGNDVQAAVETLAPYVHSRKTGGKLGAVFIKVEKENEVVKTPEIPESLEVNKPQISQPQAYKEKSMVSKFFEKVKKPSVYIKNLPDDAYSQKRKVTQSIGIILILILITSIFFGIRQKRQKEQKELFQEKLTQVLHSLEEAEGLAQLNPSRSRELFVQGREGVLGLMREGVDNPQLEELSKRISENEKRILGEFRVQTETFVDLSLLTNGFTGDQMVASRGVVFVLDKSGKKVVRVLISSKRAEIVAGPTIIDEIDSIVSYLENLYYLSANGVFKVDEGKTKVIEPEWSGSVLGYSYAGNFYILDKGESTIWRYTGGNLGFSSKRNWFAEGVVADLTSARMWVIDGSIWVLTEEGKILKFTLGNPQSFKITGVFPEIQSPKAIYTDEDLDNLYILDSENNRVVVVSKEGEYKAQYLSDEIKNAKGLVVSEEEKKIILLTGDKLLAIETEHLD